MEKPSPHDILEHAFAQYSDAIFRHCWFRLGNRESAKDLVQDVFARTWDYLMAGNEIDNMRAFLYRVAHNLVVNARIRTQPVSLEDTIESDRSREPSEDNRQAAYAKLEVEQALERLSQVNPAHTEVIVLRYIDGMAVKDIAELLSISENAASVRIHRALEALRDIIPHTP